VLAQVGLPVVGLRVQAQVALLEADRLRADHRAAAAVTVPAAERSNEGAKQKPGAFAPGFFDRCVEAYKAPMFVRLDSLPIPKRGGVIDGCAAAPPPKRYERKTRPPW
jgi:hypothetical protein